MATWGSEEVRNYSSLVSSQFKDSEDSIRKLGDSHLTAAQKPNAREWVQAMARTAKIGDLLASGEFEKAAREIAVLAPQCEILDRTDWPNSM